jgi:sulfite reductase (NADPH) flavoprotein alpha-component
MSVSLIPESAPFTPEQRAWLNGFLAGWMGLSATTASGAANGLADALGAAGGPAAGVGTAIAATEEEQYPWHDPAIELPDRLKLAEAKPRARQLMAAMAQLDCGACGYLCKTYAEAIDAGSEKNLTLCAPGGSPTSKMLKKLLAATPATGQSNGSANGAMNSAASGSTNGAAHGAVKGVVEAGRSKEHPIEGRLLESRPLNGADSAKDTRHVAIDLAGSGLTYQVGDALGVWPTNCDRLVEGILQRIAADGSLPVVSPLGRSCSLAEALRSDCCLKFATDPLFSGMSDLAADGEQARELIALAEDSSPLEGMDVLDVIERFDSVRWDAKALMTWLAPMQPRLYSIASSQAKHPTQVHLTVGKVTWHHGARDRKGVASTFLSDRVASGDGVRVFVKSSHGFSVPADDQLPMIMIGPGTGIAPFMAFLQEREMRNAKGENWLFFGDQRQSCDFLYRDQLLGWQSSGLLSRLDLAFSRDQQAKVYVQDRMMQSGATLWQWLQRGSHVYVCGDAKRMAVDVDRALQSIVAQHGNLSAADAKAYVGSLAKGGRYAKDVY